MYRVRQLTPARKIPVALIQKLTLNHSQELVWGLGAKQENIESQWALLKQYFGLNERSSA